VETCCCCQGQQQQQQQQQQQRRGQENQATAVEQRAKDEVDAMETCRRAVDSGMEIQAGLRDGIVHVAPDYWHWLLPVTLQTHQYKPLQLYHNTSFTQDYRPIDDQISATNQSKQQRKSFPLEIN